MNEKMLLTVPKPLLHTVGKSYLNGFRKKAEQHLQRQNQPNFPENDWLITYRNLDDNSFEIDIHRCGFIIIAKNMAWKECCNCHYELQGTCPLHAPKGMK